jgi:hypothetical protein
MVVLPLGLLVVTLAVAGQIAAGCVFAFQDDCARTFGFGCPPSGATSGGGASTTGSTSTGGGAVGCTDASMCPAVSAGLCASLGTATCTGGKCGVSYQAGPSPSQKYGSCKVNVCDETGTQTSVADAGNVFVDDGNSCSQYPCVNGKPTYMPKPLDTICLRPGSTTSTGYCEPDPFTMIFVCAECSSMSSCGAGYSCDHGKCDPNHCTDGIPDVDETGTDCGGPACLPCAQNQPCKIPTDCASGICLNHIICSAPSCADNVQNGSETDTDCGGSCPSPCGDTQKCSVPADCQSGVCLPTGPGLPNRCAAPTCTDGVQNSDETGIDCGGDGRDGGLVCPPCATGDAGG